MTLSDTQMAALLSVLKNKNNPNASLDKIKSDAKEIMEFISFDLQILYSDLNEKLLSKYEKKSQ